VAEKLAVQLERPQQLVADGSLVTFLYLLLFHPPAHTQVSFERKGRSLCYQFAAKSSAVLVGFGGSLWITVVFANTRTSFVHTALWLK
jgi:hypothetical protein